MRSPAVIAGFSSELTKLALTYRELGGIGAGTGAMLNMGARAKALVGADYHPEAKGRTLVGDTAKGALAAISAGALLAAISRGSLKLPKR